MALLLFLAPPVALVTGCRSKAFSMLGRGRMGASLLPQGHGEQFRRVTFSRSHQGCSGCCCDNHPVELSGREFVSWCPSTRSPGDGG